MKPDILYNLETKRTKIFSEEYDVIYSGNLRGVTHISGKAIIYSGIENFQILKIEQFLKNKLQQEIEILVKKYTEFLRVKYDKISIRKTKTRWGSCSSKGNLSFNLYLILLPYHIVEYVVVHEVCHLVEMNHSHKFWLLVKSLYPNYREARQYIKLVIKNGQLKC